MTIKTSMAAIATLVIGCVSLVLWGLAVLLGSIFPAPPGHTSPAMGSAGLLFMCSMLGSYMLAKVVLVTAIVALFSVGLSMGKRKGIGLALLGIALAGVPYLLLMLWPNL